MGDETTLDAGSLAAPASVAAPRAYLLVRQGPRTDVLHLDEGAEVLFGRSRAATVHLDDPKISREHLRIKRVGNELRAEDLGGRNGTRLNGALLEASGLPSSAPSGRGVPTGVGLPSSAPSGRGVPTGVGLPSSAPSGRGVPTGVGLPSSAPSGRGVPTGVGLRSGDLLTLGDVEIVVAETAPKATHEPRRLEAELRGLGARAVLVRLPVDADELATLPELASARLVEAQPDGDYACLFDDARLARALVSRVDGATISEGGSAGWAKTAKRDAPKLPPAIEGVIVADPAMVAVYDHVRKVASAPTTVLILGETGSGKEIVAEQIHEQSPRKKGPFVRLNCGSLPETLLESELFGHERGAFTGADKRKLGYIEAAAGGTLFLDEIGELPLPMQTRLLRALETRRFMRVGGREEIEVDVRFVAATHRDLPVEVKAGRFREDLYFRLSTFIIKLPPLRQRPAEIALLAELFARDLSKRMGSALPTISQAAMQRLERHAWPGNVRELRNAMERAVVLSGGSAIEPEHLPEALGEGAAPEGAMKEQIADVERRAIQAALDAEGGVQTRAAKRLGISRRALQYKLEKLKSG